MKFVNCPICGHKLLEADVNSFVRVKCVKCKSIIQVKVNVDRIDLLSIKESIDAKRSNKRE